ncbi:MAG: DUF3341 domain-containing protein [Deltaproteobacteria bacterium]|nr:DUF3341 domain-containing protein [Deltaproteobacteria bacterium]
MRNDKGLLALFEHPDDLISAVKKIRSHHFTKFDAYTPFAVHGLDHAMGLKRSWVPYVTIAIALMGAGLGFLFQAWALSTSWPVNVGGKPMVGWPAFIPVTFELTILTSGVSTSLLLFGLCWPFDFRKPSLDPRLTNDRFGLFIEERDAKFDEELLTKLLKETHAEEIKKII